MYAITPKALKWGLIFDLVTIVARSKYYVFTNNHICEMTIVDTIFYELNTWGFVKWIVSYHISVAVLIVSKFNTSGAVKRKIHTIEESDCESLERLWMFG